MRDSPLVGNLFCVIIGEGYGEYKNMIEDIKKENSRWNWGGFSFDDFIGKLSLKERIIVILKRKRLHHKILQYSYLPEE